MDLDRGNVKSRHSTMRLTQTPYKMHDADAFVPWEKRCRFVPGGFANSSECACFSGAEYYLGASEATIASNRGSPRIGSQNG